MEKQLIISVGREFGSGGHIVAERLAKKYGLPLYDRNLLKEVAAERNLDSKELEYFDESKRNKWLTRTVNGMNSSAADNVANLQFDFLRKKAEEGKSFVVVGRCAESILKEYKGLVSIFILADVEDKIAHLMEEYHISAEEAEAMRIEKDKKRKQYHNSHCSGKWGDSRNYGISINLSTVGMDETVRILSEYIDSKMKKEI